MSAIVKAPFRNDVLDVSQPPSHYPIWKFLLEWIGAGALVVGVVLAMIGLGIAVVVVISWLVNALSSLMSR